MSSVRDRLRVAVAEYEEHRDRTAREGADPDADWWYAAWAEALVPVLKEIADTLAKDVKPELRVE